jgi:hypothetical protein
VVVVDLQPNNERSGMPRTFFLLALVWLSFNCAETTLANQNFQHAAIGSTAV